MKKRSLCISAIAALSVAAALAGCGSTTYFAGRVLPPSGITNRVLVAIQNPSTLNKGVLQIEDAYYDIRSSYNGKVATFSISGYSGALPVTIQNMPEQQLGAVYGSGDGSFILVNYQTEKTGSTLSPTSPSASIFVTRNVSYIFSANPQNHVFTVQDKTGTGGTYSLSLPGVYRVSVNPGGSMALAFVQNSNYVYYPRKLSSAETVAYNGGPSTWPTAAVDCEPQNAPGWCLFQAQDPGTGNPLVFNRPIKAVFSADGGTAYVLSCGPECGGNTAPVSSFPATAAVSSVPVAPFIFLIGQASGNIPTQSAVNAATVAVPGGASNALVDGSTLYVVGQQPQTIQGQTLFGGNLTVVNLATTPATVPAPVSISDGAPGAMSRIAEGDDNTLWIAMTKCTNGVRAATGEADGCLTMYNTSTGTATLLPYIGDATGIAPIIGLHKLYSVQAGQVYINSTVDGSSIDNSYVTIQGTAYDIAYMDAASDSSNTVY